MKLLFAAILSVVIFSSCTKESRSPDSQSKKDTTTQKSTTGTNTNSQNARDNKTETAGTSSGELKNLSYEPGKLPAGVKYEGKVVAGARWEDNNGQNVIIVTETEEKASRDERSKELFAYQYIINGDNVKQLWKVNDFIKDCPVDVTMELFPKSISITDLDKNGIAENTFIYKMACKGDVSPDDMKLIMHEGESKYALRGSMKMIMEGQSYGGEMKPDPSFDKAPKEFLTYAKEQWSKFNTVKVGN